MQRRPSKPDDPRARPCHWADLPVYRRLLRVKDRCSPPRPSAPRAVLQQIEPRFEGNAARNNKTASAPRGRCRRPRSGARQSRNSGAGHHLVIPKAGARMISSRSPPVMLGRGSRACASPQRSKKPVHVAGIAALVGQAPAWGRRRCRRCRRPPSMGLEPRRAFPPGNARKCSLVEEPPNSRARSTVPPRPFGRGARRHGDRCPPG